MTFLQPIAFEVNAASGSSGNGGGFDDTSGTPGTNYAWGAGQTTIAYTDIAATGAVAVGTSVARPFIAADVGNVINLTAGTNIVTGRFQIISVSAGAATFDRNIATAAATGGTGTLGGSLATIQQGINACFISTGAVPDSRCYVKKGAYTGTIALITTSSVGPTKYRNRVIGYFTTHGDQPLISSGNQPSYAVGSGAGVAGMTISTSGFSIENITFDGTVSSGTKGTTGVNITSTFNSLYNCKVTTFSAEGMAFASNCAAIGCEVTACAGTTGAINTSNGAIVAFCWIHKNTKGGIAAGNANSIFRNIISNNTQDGVTSNLNCLIVGNTFYGNRDGIRASNSYDAAIASLWQGNIFAKGTGYGINFPTTPAPPTLFPVTDYNAFYSNTTANYNNLTAGTHDVAISINPFNSSDANLASETAPDWGLNATSSAGASLRAAGFPGALSALTTTVGFADIGLAQHQDSGGAGGGLLTYSALDGL